MELAVVCAKSLLSLTGRALCLVAYTFAGVACVGLVWFGPWLFKCLVSNVLHFIVEDILESPRFCAGTKPISSISLAPRGGVSSLATCASFASTSPFILGIFLYLRSPFRPENSKEFNERLVRKYGRNIRVQVSVLACISPVLVLIFHCSQGFGYVRLLRFSSDIVLRFHHRWTTVSSHTTPSPSTTCTSLCPAPAYLAHIDPPHSLNTQSDRYPKPWQMRRFLSRLTGGDVKQKAVSVAEGPYHHRLRKIIAPAFAPSTIKGLAPIFIRKAGELCEHWRAVLSEPTTPVAPGVEMSKDGKTIIEINNWLGRAAFDIIGLAAFGYSFNSLRDDSNELFAAYMRLHHVTREGPTLRENLTLAAPWLQPFLVILSMCFTFSFI